MLVSNSFSASHEVGNEEAAEDEKARCRSCIARVMNAGSRWKEAEANCSKSQGNSQPERGEGVASQVAP